ncbi:hypothetical protein [Acetobacter musti]|uniref:hypothetical protein n=1 Tax=Acetobacter musti TaxID=864732 RepID=UPI001F54E9F1|nr:hypothetical protein [Acetobacter musti]
MQDKRIKACFDDEKIVAQPGLFLINFPGLTGSYSKIPLARIFQPLNMLCIVVDFVTKAAQISVRFKLLVMKLLMDLEGSKNP